MSLWAHCMIMQAVYVQAFIGAGEKPDVHQAGCCVVMGEEGKDHAQPQGTCEPLVLMSEGLHRRYTFALTLYTISLALCISLTVSSWAVPWCLIKVKIRDRAKKHTSETT